MLQGWMLYLTRCSKPCSIKRIAFIKAYPIRDTRQVQTLDYCVQHDYDHTPCMILKFKHG